MKVAKLLEADDKTAGLRLLKQIALTLQDELLNELDIVTDVTLSKAVSSRWYYDGITMHLTGPLFELYMDVTYGLFSGSTIAEYRLSARTGKDAPIDGMLLLGSTIDSVNREQHPLNWLTADRAVDRLIAKKASDPDMHRYNFLWFDKIARNLEPRFELFLKSIVVNNEIMTAQILEKDMGSAVNRWALSFEHYPGDHGFCYRLKPWNAPEHASKTVRDFSDINEMLHGGD